MIQKRVATIFIITVFLLPSIFAQPPPPTTSQSTETLESIFSFLEATAEKAENLDAKAIMLLIIAAILLFLTTLVGIKPLYALPLSILASFLFTRYVSSEALIGIFKVHNPRSLYGFFSLTGITLVPLIIFLLLTLFAVYRKNTTLIIVQFLFWILSLLIVATNLALYYLQKYNIPQLEEIKKIISIPPYGESGYWLLSSIVVLFISFIMVIGNKSILLWIESKMREMELLQAAQGMHDIQTLTHLGEATSQQLKKR